MVLGEICTCGAFSHMHMNATTLVETLPYPSYNVGHNTSKILSLIF